MKIIGILGSPRKNGNSAILLDEALKGAASSGASTEVIYLNDLTIAPCQHCDYCLKEGTCRQKDDMQMIYSKFDNTDAIILASPIHFGGLTAQAKLMIDRFQAIWARKYRLKIPGHPKNGLLVLVGGRQKEDFSGAISTVKAFFPALDIKLEEMLLYPGFDEAGAIRNKPEALREAFLAGKRLAETSEQPR